MEEYQIIETYSNFMSTQIIMDWKWYIFYQCLLVIGEMKNYQICY
jgi:hypothetical protein